MSMSGFTTNGSSITPRGRAAARRAIIGRSSIRLGERAGVAEQLGQLVGDRVHMVADLTDELAASVVVEMADEPSRECGVMEEFLESGSGNGDGHACFGGDGVGKF